MDKLIVSNYLGLNNLKIKCLEEYERPEKEKQIIYQYNLIRYYLGAVFDNEEEIASNTKVYHGRFHDGKKFNLFNNNDKIIVLYPEKKVLKRVFINIKLLYLKGDEEEVKTASKILEDTSLMHKIINELTFKSTLRLYSEEKRFNWDRKNFNRMFNSLRNKEANFIIENKDIVNTMSFFNKVCGNSIPKSFNKLISIGDFWINDLKEEKKRKKKY